MPATATESLDVPHPVHGALASLVTQGTSPVVIDLGCGRGATLAAVAALYPEAVVVGLDLDHEALRQARDEERVLSVRADLSTTLPLANESADVVVSHNVLELLPDPVRVMSDARRILRARGRAIWSHTDFANIAVTGGDDDLTARIVHAYAYLPQPWMGNVDPLIGHKLPDIARAAGLRIERQETHVCTRTRMEGQARRRLQEVKAVVHEHIGRGQFDLGPDDIDRWWESLVNADQQGEFHFRETALLCVSAR